MRRLLETIDAWVADNRPDGDFEPPHGFAPTRVEDSPPLALDLADGRFGAILWATGYRPDYSWLHARVLDRKGQIRHDAGVVTGAPGLYRIGLNMLRRRKSSFIHGAEDDARDLTEHLAAHIGAPAIA
jgi:putative flavoprotein involved in K+ transport